METMCTHTSESYLSHHALQEPLHQFDHALQTNNSFNSQHEKTAGKLPNTTHHYPLVADTRYTIKDDVMSEISVITTVCMICDSVCTVHNIMCMYICSRYIWSKCIQ